MSTRTKKFFLVAGQLLITLVAFGVDGSYSPIANLTERFTNSPGWTANGAGSIGLVDQSLRWSCLNQAMPITRIGSMNAGSISSGGRFVGDYVKSAITHISFDVERTTVASGALLKFVCANGHLWYYAFQLPMQTNVWEHREIPITYTDEWKCDDIAGDYKSTFDSDLTQVKEIGVQGLAVGTSAQDLRVDNFKALGPWEKGPMTNDEMPIYWLTENGLPAQDGQAGLDKDGDGFSNFAEYLAGTDASDAKSQFKVSIETGVDGKPVLSWKHENYRSYKVLKSADLSVTNSFVEETGSIQTVGADNKMSVNSAAGDVSFYRVQVDKVP